MDAYTPLTPEQYQSALDAGFTPDQIIQHEQTRKASAQTSPAEPLLSVTDKVPLLGPLLRTVDSTISSGTDQAAQAINDLRTKSGFDAKVQALHNLLSGVAKPYAIPAAMMAAPTMLANPAGTIGAIGGGILGSKGATAVAPMLGAGPGVTAAAGDVGGILGGVGGGILGPKVASMVGNGVANVLGGTTGAGAEPIKQAFAGTPNVQQFMRGDQNDSALVGTLKDATDTIKQQRAAEYQTALQELGKNTAPLDITPITDVLDKKLTDFGVKVVPPPPSPPPNLNGSLAGATPDQLQALRNAPGVSQYLKSLNDYAAQYGNKKPGTLDFSASTINNRGAQSDVARIVNDVRNWQDTTPLGIDTLKRRIGDFYSDSSQARALVANVQGAVKDTLNQVPGYQDMTKQYAQQSGLLDAAKKELSADNPNVGTTVRKLQYGLNQANNYRSGLLDSLDQAAGTNVKGAVAGSALRSWTPKGLARVAGTSPFAAAMYFHNPGLIPLAALSSPRAVGEGAGLLGAISRSLPKGTLPPGLAGLLGGGSVEFLNQEGQ